MRRSLEYLDWRGQFTVLLWDYMVKCFGENSWLFLWIWKHLIYVNFVVLGKINSWMSWFREATESGIFGICSSKCVFLVPSWWQLWPIPWPGDCNLSFLYSNSVTYGPDFYFYFFFLQHLVMRFFRKKAAEPAFMHLWAHNTPCGWFIRSTTAFCRLLEPLCKHALLCSTSWFQQKFCPELQGCDGFCLAPPPKFYGVPSSSVTTISLSS